MATSTCVRCGSTSFEVVPCAPALSKFRYIFVQCAACGGVVGALDWVNIGVNIEHLNLAMKDLLVHLGVDTQAKL